MSTWIDQAKNGGGNGFALFLLIDDTHFFLIDDNYQLIIQDGGGAVTWTDQTKN